ncbi:outer membrane beta-barrel protein [Cyclobacterium plantarum]|uniref:Porin family protein n=1 Tax=Cyclobacterium plantarum TaxID=2716263 RepID=A0ABX0H5P7_9BACT|nr:outer membrane beta-barrel protein [Cyclobacterium plantarum]NHE55772.1 porin family protein [Cyclobacterium plantarum]
MKKSILILLLSGLIQWVHAQEIRVNLYGGYVFKDRVDSYFSRSSYYDGQIQDGGRLGGGIEYLIPDRGGLEIQYLRQNTNAPTVYLDDILSGGQVRQTDFDLRLNWLMLNGTRYFPISEHLEPFAGIGLGMGIFSLTNPDTKNERSTTKLAYSARGGINLWLIENLAFRAQASLFSAVQSMGGGFYFGTGGSGVGLNSYSSMFQFGFDGGLVFRIPQN